MNDEQENEAEGRNGGVEGEEEGGESPTHASLQNSAGEENDKTKSDLMRRFKREKKKKNIHIKCKIDGRSDVVKLCVKDGQKIKWLSLAVSAKLQQQTRSRRGWSRQRNHRSLLQGH